MLEQLGPSGFAWKEQEIKFYHKILSRNIRCYLTTIAWCTCVEITKDKIFTTAIDAYSKIYIEIANDGSNGLINRQGRQTR